MSKARIGIIIKIVALAFVVIITTSAAFAWFSTTFESENGVKYQTGDGTFPVMHAWMFNMTQEESGEDTAKVGTWVSAATATSASPSSDGQINIDSEEEGYLLSGVVLNNSNSITEKYVFKSLHLGTIDNLLSLSNDNYLYLRFDITTPNTMGRIACASYLIGETDFHFYDATSADQTAAVITKATTYNKQSIFSEMVGVECVASTTAYAPGANLSDLESLFENNGTLLENGAELSEIYTDENNTTYYFYVRFFPDLEKCTEATDYFGEYMPCEILFDVEFTVEFRFYEGDLDE